MKILFDYQTFYLQKFGGISNVYTQLMKNLPADVEYELALHESNNVHLHDSGIRDVPPMSCTMEDFLTGGYFRGKERLYNLYTNLFPSRTALGRNRQCSINALKRGDFDIFHPTFFDSYFLPYLNGKPFVLTIYDMISERFWSERNAQTVNKLKQASEAAHIIAISEKTKEDVVEILKVPEEKVSVMYLAASDIEIEQKEPIVEGKYILYVGNRAQYKNFLPMLESLLPVLNRHRELKMVCTGPKFDEEELKMFKENHLRDRMIYIKPSDKELRNLYHNAVCFIYPSLYEGFGIPILEAWQSDCPVLLNRKSCFPEIAQDGAIFFNLDENGSDLAETMENFLQMNETEMKGLLGRQRKRLADFSWKKSAQRLVDIYRNILQK